MKKVVLKVEVNDDKGKQKAMKAVSCISGIDSVSMDMKSKKLTVIGDVDPVVVVSKIRKSGQRVSLDSVGPAKEEKKDDKKKDDGKKDDGKKKDGDGKKKDPTEKQVEEMVKAYQAYRPYYTTDYSVHSWEDDPNKCVIC